MKKGALSGNKNWKSYKRNSMVVIQPGQHLPQGSAHGGVPNRRSSIEDTLSSLQQGEEEAQRCRNQFPVGKKLSVKLQALPDL